MPMSSNKSLQNLLGSSHGLAHLGRRTFSAWVRYTRGHPGFQRRRPIKRGRRLGEAYQQRLSEIGTGDISLFAKRWCIELILLGESLFWTWENKNVMRHKKRGIRICIFRHIFEAKNSPKVKKLCESCTSRAVDSLVNPMRKFTLGFGGNRRRT